MDIQLLSCPNCKREIKPPKLFPVFCSCRYVIQAPEGFVPEPVLPPKIMWDLPGTELKNMLAEFGIRWKQKCGCQNTAKYMDGIGFERCREEIDWLSSEMKTNAKEFGWLETIGRATMSAILSPNARKTLLAIDLTNPYRSLILEACRRVETKKPQ